ncbi:MULTISPECIES: M24 family metallopeptidase [Bradyrhizobium]|jgi:Xaa-Pro dipeptidase|uniref:Xaa-Pro dipeptidase n=1 Tax=Bradyrhizobium elkanii TaxID=29448 RepID=A0ABV4EQH5_BRAEL|nr:MULTISPECIES: Xaa-Pro peptidase family protein [Bradyrhizobium]MDI2060685.1 Xaa-Pro peptidase family protein [Bradyrhizobium sp. Mp19]NWL42835.1 aminopeptidase P family protein [Bradyrhizobium elkanii]NWL75105.1 aminopeptidase P family protein [Bradyrhizobium elkanii]OIM88970.1 peptidase M24 [Bradyrhizobium elkanii]WLA44687.1 Xaa-Pro peptidase family protein [Bradyrhizobium elkanii]
MAKLLQSRHSRKLVNLDRLEAVLGVENVDALVASSPENVTYASGYWALSQWIRRGPQTYVVIPRKGPERSTVVASTALLDLLADQNVWVSNVRRFGYFQMDRAERLRSGLDKKLLSFFGLPDDGTPLEALAKALIDAGVARGRIALDELGLLPGNWERLQDLLPNATLVPGYGLFRKIRAIKTTEEINRLRYSAQVAEQSIQVAVAEARTDITEIEMARAFHRKTVESDCQPVLGCIGFGARSAMPNVQPSDARLVDGDIIRFDVGGRFKHYRSDIARIAVFGEPSAKIKLYHRALHRGVQAALEMIKPGVKAADVFARAVDVTRKEGITHFLRSHVGHGIGIDGYDLPDLTPISPDLIEEGMVMCVEAPYYETGWGGLQVEDTVVVHADGIETFMTTDGSLMVPP